MVWHLCHWLPLLRPIIIMVVQQQQPLQPLQLVAVCITCMLLTTPTAAAVRRTLGWEVGWSTPLCPSSCQQQQEVLLLVVAAMLGVTCGVGAMQQQMQQQLWQLLALLA